MTHVATLQFAGAPPRKIVSLVPSQTELLADLGLNEEVVGITRFCVHPSEWKERKTIVGGTKNIILERVTGLEPDLIIANREENEREQVESLAELAPVHVTDVSTIDDALSMIRQVGSLVHRRDEARHIAESVEKAFSALPRLEPVRAAYLIWRDPYMVAGGDTFISDVMKRAGLLNVLGDRPRYPEVTLDHLASAEPEVLLLSSEPFPFTRAHGREIADGTGIRTIFVDGEMFSWYGSRMLRMPRYLALLGESIRGS